MSAYERECYLDLWNSDLHKISGDILPSSNSLSKSGVESEALLYHYTDAAGVLGIVTKKELWLTESAFLNDKEEVVHVYRICGDIASGELLKHSSPKATTLLNCIKEAAATDRSHEFVNSYSISFSRHHNQWRMYGSNGLGYALEFRMSALKRLEHLDDVAALNAGAMAALNAGAVPYQRGIYLDEVDYDQSKVASLIAEIVSRVLAIKGQWPPPYEDSVRWTIIRGTQWFLYHLGAMFKRPEFSHEGECRLTEYVGFYRLDQSWSKNVQFVSRGGVHR
jgi:hypothetical protein